MAVFRTVNGVTGGGRPSPGQIINGTATDGPTERLGKQQPKFPAPQQRRSRIPLLTLAIAGLALNLAAMSGLLAWRALGVARGAANAPTAQPVTHGSFSVSYAQEPLKVQVGCSAVLYIDLDEPRSNADPRVSDLRYDSRCGNQPPRLSLGPGATAGSEVKDPDIDAAGCDQAIRTSPLGPGASVEAKKGVVLCVLTGATPAQMILVEVTDVGTSGIASMRATGWKVTG